MSEKLEELQGDRNFQSNAANGVRVTLKTCSKNCKRRNQTFHNREPEKQIAITPDSCEQKKQLAEC